MMFNTETIARIGLPNANNCITEWLAGAERHSVLYIGNRRLENASDRPSEMPIPRRWVTPPSNRSTCFTVLVLLEGRDDATTGLVFKDIADIVHDGLQSLGHESRIVYCANLVVDNCFREEEFVVVLAPHILASYFTEHGTLAAVGRHLVPPHAGNIFFLTRTKKGSCGLASVSCRSGRYSLDNHLYRSSCMTIEKGGKMKRVVYYPGQDRHRDLHVSFWLPAISASGKYLRRIY